LRIVDRRLPIVRPAGASVEAGRIADCRLPINGLPIADFDCRLPILIADFRFRVQPTWAVARDVACQPKLA
jgi:hypothetical protein